MKLIEHFFIIVIMWLNTSTLLAQTTATVIRVVDGDTYQILKDNKVFTVRLANVDAPETKQSFGIVAKQNVSALILYKSVLIDSLTKDKYNRVIASVWINGMALDSILISNGWAWHYVEYSNKPELAMYQSKAIKRRLGLWKCGTNNVCKPSVYRGLSANEKQKYSAECTN